MSDARAMMTVEVPVPVIPFRKNAIREITGMQKYATGKS